MRHRADPVVARGKTVFASACAGCHTLTGRDTTAPGGDLGIAKLSDSAIASFVHVMPVRISARDIRAVAAYIHAVSGS